MAAFLEDILSRRLHFFSGKGGVGKSTLTLAVALACKRQGKRCLIAGWNPFEVPSFPLAEKFGIEWLALETLSCFKEYALQSLKFEKVYDVVFDNHVLRTFLKAAPGISDGVIAGKIWDVTTSKDYDHVFVDLPSSGHTVSFFLTPRGLSKIFKFGFVHRQAEDICDLFGSDESRLHFVSLPEELSIAENLELKRKLEKDKVVRSGYLLMNQLTPLFNLPTEADLPEKLISPYRSYRDRLAKDEEALEMAKGLELPILKIPRLTDEKAETIVERTTEWAKTL